MGVHPSGEQFRITSGSHAATIVEVGGGVREYTVDGQPVLQPYPVEAMCDGAHGTPLIPWPNRLADGRYTFGDVDYRVALTEPEKHNAIHGFLRWRSWTAVRHEPDRVTMATRLHPLEGYPFTLDVEVDYTLGESGLTVRTTATNSGARTCPYACGQHPYLSPGDGDIDDCTLHLDAATRIVTDDERQLPTGREPVEGTPYDFRSGRRSTGCRSTTPSPTSLATAEAGRGPGWSGLTAPVQRSGSTRRTRSSRSTPPTPWPHRGSGAAWAPSR